MTDDGTTVRAADLDSLIGRLADEFLRRQEAGERPDPEEYAARHPEVADLIRRALASLRLVESAGEGAAAAGGADLPTPGVLGDFRIRREVGRGGMGVVYEAEQVSLRRRVALKVLPFAAVMDPRSLQRFRNEALAAAGLDHPNVVKVYSVGSDRGVHYIAMQFVDGRTLADLIADRRPKSPPAGADDPTATYRAGLAAAETAAVAGSLTERVRPDAGFYQRAAEWAAQAADALEHAHGLGVVHRDVKPANLLVDGRGHLWVADFGLAQVAAGPGLTASGELLGTPRYMSPEQAQARHNLVDHRTDVYALGATLYELLTGAPVVDGKDRQEVLRRIASEDPVPPRRLDRSVPRDLETVTLKCLEKDPARRYASANELAAELRRYLGGEPIRARRPTVAQRIGRWVGRRPRTAVTLAVLAILGLGAAVTWQRERSRAEGEARLVAAEARELQSQGRNPEALTVARRAVDLLLRYGDGHLRRDLTGLAAELELVCRLEESRLNQLSTSKLLDFDLPPPPRYREAFLGYGIDLLTGDEAAVADALRRLGARADVVAALDDWARLAADPAERDRLDRLAEAVDDDRGLVGRARRAARDKDTDTLKRLAAEAAADPPPPAVAVQLADYLGLIEAWADAERVLRPVLAAHPGHLWLNVYLAQAIANQPRREAEAVMFARVAVVLRPHSAVAWHFLGRILKHVGRLADAEDAYRRAVALEPVMHY